MGTMLNTAREHWSYNSTATHLRIRAAWQPGDLRVLEGVAEGVWKEARTLGFASLSLDRFAFS